MNTSMESIPSQKAVDPAPEESNVISPEKIKSQAPSKMNTSMESIPSQKAIDPAPEESNVISPEKVEDQADAPLKMNAPKEIAGSKINFVKRDQQINRTPSKALSSSVANKSNLLLNSSQTYLNEDVFTPITYPIELASALSVSDFNNLAINDQINFVTNISNPFMPKLKKLIEYLLRFIKPGPPKKYLTIIPKNEDKVLSQVTIEPSNLLSYSTVEIVIEGFEKFIDILSSFSDVIIQFQFPSQSYDKAYKLLIEENNIKIMVIINKMTRSNMRFKKGNLIDYAKIAPSVGSIIGDITSGGFFAYCSSLLMVSIPLSITSIGCKAFLGCKSLKKVNFTKSSNSKGDILKTISSFAFQNCESLTEISIPDCVSLIGEQAFEVCLNLSIVNLPNSCIEIKSKAFDKCPHLKEVQISPSVVYDTFSFSCKVTILK